jgi:Zn-finger nucleic acid-binding protein
MSTVRMCDKCNAIFSENEEGWMSSPSSIMKRDSNGQVKQITVQVDQCPSCVEVLLGTGNKSPKAIVPPVRGRYDRRYTEQLEEEAGIRHGNED